MLHLLLGPAGSSFPGDGAAVSTSTLLWEVEPLVVERAEIELSAGLLIFREKKKQNFAVFSGANSRKNRPISRHFRGKKVKIRGTIVPISGDFRGRKVKIRRKIGPFRGIFAEKSQFSKDFRGQILQYS